jgi:hypothetical protein
MNSAHAHNPPATSNSTRSTTRPLWIWLPLQLIPLILAAARIPLSVNHPRPAESLALHLLLVTQIVASALLWPILLHSGASTLLVVVSAWPFVFLSAFLGFVPIERAAPAALYVSLWLLTLSFLPYTMQSQRPRLLAVSFTSALTLGCPLLWYLATEFGGSILAPKWINALSPIANALALLNGTQASPAPWILIVTLLFGTLLMALYATCRRRFALALH